MFIRYCRRLQVAHNIAHRYAITWVYIIYTARVCGVPLESWPRTVYACCRSNSIILSTTTMGRRQVGRNVCTYKTRFVTLCRYEQPELAAGWVTCRDVEVSAAHDRLSWCAVMWENNIIIHWEYITILPTIRHQPRVVRLEFFFIFCHLENGSASISHYVIL